MLTLVLTFLVLAAVIAVAGTYLARFADQLGEITGLGQSMAGLLLLAIATSLPELSVGCNAGAMGVPDLTMGDVLGSCLFNLLILAVLDLCSHTKGRMLSRAAAAHALSAAASITLTAIVLVFLLVDVPWPFAAMGPGSIVVAVAYLLCMRLIFFDVQFAKGQSDVAVVDAAQPISTRVAVVGYLVCAGAILLAAPPLTTTATELAEVTGLGKTFFGTCFVAFVTSLPEVVTTLTAIRMGALDMAIGNVLGSNSFNLLILVAVDFFYDGPLLASVSPTHAITAACVILVTAVTIMGLVYRAEKRYWLIEPDAALVILLVLSSLALVYRTGV